MHEMHMRQVHRGQIIARAVERTMQLASGLLAVPRSLGDAMDRICGKCSKNNEAATWDALESCPFCGAIYAKVDQHIAITAQRSRVDAESRAAAAAKRSAELAAAAVREERAAAAKRAATQRRLESSLICTTCGSIGAAKSAVRGSTGMELLLWMLSLTVIMFPVAIIYSVWRMGSRHKKCRRCGSEQLVPVGTPAGRRLYAEFHGAQPLNRG